MEHGPLDYAPPQPRRRTPAWAALAVLTVALAVLLEGLCASGAFRSRVQVLRAQRANAAADLAMLSTALEQFRQDCGRYPTAAEGVTALSVPPPQLPGWRGPYIKRLADPWGSAFSYAPPPIATSNAYRVICAGPDMQVGTADDLTATGPAVSLPPGSP